MTSPGPWSVDADRALNNIVISDAHGGVVCEVCDAPEGPEREQYDAIPNARLIAQAPAMLQIIREITGTAHPLVDLGSAIKHAITLLAETRGGR